MLSLVLPTFNEAQNLPELIPRIEAALEGLEYEIIVVDDDSPDGTWRIGLELAKSHPSLRVIRRVGRRGLSSAVIEGFLAATGDVLAVMDADGQHDTGLLAQLYESVTRTQGIALGSRYAEGGSVGQWDERRHLMSRVATQLSLRLCAVKVADPMSGFFAIDRELFERTRPRLNSKGFKILLDLLVQIPKDTAAEELAFTFGSRMHGESKLSGRVQLEFLEYLYDVTVGRLIPLTFVKFCIVGAFGVLVHLAVFKLARHLLEGTGDDFGFRLSKALAIEVAIVSNFLLNNVWTFSHVRLVGVDALTGFFKFNAACALGALADLAVADYLHRSSTPETVAVLAGAFVGALWNYGMNRLVTWRAA